MSSLFKHAMGKEPTINSAEHKTIDRMVCTLCAHRFDQTTFSNSTQILDKNVHKICRYWKPQL